MPIGLTVAGWGRAVLRVLNGPVPDARQAPVYLIGTAVRLLAAHLLARAWNIALTGALLSVLSSGIALVLAYEIGALGNWPFWTAVLAAWGVLEAFRPSGPS